MDDHDGARGRELEYGRLPLGMDRPTRIRRGPLDVEAEAVTSHEVLGDEPCDVVEGGGEVVWGECACVCSFEVAPGAENEEETSGAGRSEVR